MLIPIEKILKYIQITSVIHIGAHLGEEAELYFLNGINNTLWIEANIDLMNQLKKNISKYPSSSVLNAVLSKYDDQEVVFNISNSSMSSSILDLGYHKVTNPDISFVQIRKMNTITLNTLLSQNNIPYDKFEFLNVDIQGAELLMLEGATKILPYVKGIYSEVNFREVYKGCPRVSEIDSFLLKWNFRRIVTAWHEDSGWGDAFYIKMNDSKLSHLKYLILHKIDNLYSKRIIIYLYFKKNIKNIIKLKFLY